MKHQFAYAIAVFAAAAACAPAETKPDAAASETPMPAPAVPAVEAITLAPISLVGGWAGTITCYKIESPLTVDIDSAGPGKAEVAQGDGGAMKWTASVSVDSPTRMVTLKADTSTDGANVLAGPLSADMTEIAGKMDNQLCTDFRLKRVS